MTTKRFDRRQLSKQNGFTEVSRYKYYRNQTSYIFDETGMELSYHTHSGFMFIDFNEREYRDSKGYVYTYSDLSHSPVFGLLNEFYNVNPKSVEIGQVANTIRVICKGLDELNAEVLSQTANIEALEERRVYEISKAETFLEEYSKEFAKCMLDDDVDMYDIKSTIECMRSLKRSVEILKEMDFSKESFTELRRIEERLNEYGYIKIAYGADSWRGFELKTINTFSDKYMGGKMKI